jgi:hypothetical protein
MPIELLRLIKCGKYAESRESGSTTWEDAYLGQLFYQDIYAATIAPRNNPDLHLYTTAVISNWWQHVDIPLLDETPVHLLTDWMNNLDTIPNLNLRDFFTTHIHHVPHDQLMAMLNRKIANTEGVKMAQWIKDFFGFKLSDRFGPVSIGSHGEATKYGFSYNLTIKSDLNSLLSAKNLSQLVQRRIRNITIQPLSREKYIEDLRNAMR